MGPLKAYLGRTRTTERALAERAGLSVPMINQIKAGTRRPSPEAAKRIEAATDGQVSAASLLGLSETGSAFEHQAPPRPLNDGRWSATVSSDGSLFLPSAMVSALGFAPGERIVARPERDDVRINSSDRALIRIQAELQALVPPGVSVVDQFIADKRAEAARD